MTLIFFGGAAVAWICLALPNALAIQFLLRRMRGEAPNYWNAFFATVVSGATAQLASLALFFAFGSAASLLVFFILAVFLYSKLLRLPSGNEVSYGQSLAILFMQFVLPVALLFSFPVLDVSGKSFIGDFLAEYGSYLLFLLVFFVLFFTYNPYRKSREGSLDKPRQEDTSRKFSVAHNDEQDSLGMADPSNSKKPAPFQSVGNDHQAKENARAAVGPGMLQGPSGAIRLSGIAIVLSCLFPPWCIQTQVRTVHVGYSFFLNPPGPGTTVNTSLLLVQICAIFLCGAAFWLAGRK